MEFKEGFQKREKKLVGESNFDAVVTGERAQVRFVFGNDLLKSSCKFKKEEKNTQQKKNVTINVDFLKALGHFGLGNEDKDEQLQQLNLTFNELSYSIKQGIKRETKIILNNLHGEFRAGELTGIIGPSGSGKSSLINILAGFTTAGVTGSIKINDEERDMTSFTRRSCYIMQNDELHPLLTAEEAILLAANLKLGSDVSGGRKTPVKKMLESLGLLECRQVLSGKLSDGQRRRLAIALELVNNPPVIFLDEPTSGLDSSSSKQCITLLKELAESGRTVVCILHQPSASLFDMIDHLYVVREGSCIYSGDSKGLLPFLAEYGLRCPRYHNPADFMLEVATMLEYREVIPDLVSRIKNGKCPNWRKIITKTDKSLANWGSRIKKDRPVTTDDSISVFTIPYGKRRRPRSISCTYPTSFWRQFYIILIWHFKKISRNLLLVHTICGALMGSFFYGIGNDAVFILDNFGFQFFCLMWNMFTSYSSAVSFYPQERPILLREYFNKWYSLRAYFFATNLANLPLQILCTLLFTTISYFMSSQPMEADRFLKIILIALVVASVGQGFGYLVGSAMNIQNAAIFGALLMAPFLLFSGYFVLLVDSPESLKWLFHISYYKYALEGVMDTIYGNNRDKMKCSGDFCHYRTPQKFLKQLGMNCVDYWLDFGVLFGLSIFLRVLAYFILRFRLNYLRG